VTAVLIVSIIAISLAIFVFTVRTEDQTGTTDTNSPVISFISFRVEVVYSASWNATYYGWQGANTLIANSTLSGTGKSNLTIVLKGNAYAGIRLDLTVQKDDSSNSKLVVYVSTMRDPQPFTNSTALPFGKVFLGIGVVR
jgi:hypothetical protein